MKGHEAPAAIIALLAAAAIFLQPGAAALAMPAVGPHVPSETSPAFGTPANPEEPQAPLSHAFHLPIFISGNADFTPTNGVTGGNGTQQSPYIISGWDISLFLGPGIKVLNATAYFRVENCTVHDGMGQDSVGIYAVSCANCVIAGNAVNNVSWGIGAAYCSAPQVRSNKVHYSQSAGIFANSATNASIESNSLAFPEGSQALGISADGSADILVRDNSVLNSRYGAYMLEASRAQILNNSFRGGMESAVALHKCGGQSRAENNTVAVKAQAGILADSSPSALIRGNSLAVGEGNSVEGLFSPSLDISGNTVSSAGGYGIRLVACDDSLASLNSIASCSLAGIAVNASGGVGIWGNNVGPCAGSGILSSFTAFNSQTQTITVPQGSKAWPPHSSQKYAVVPANASGALRAVATPVEKTLDVDMCIHADTDRSGAFSPGADEEIAICTGYGSGCAEGAAATGLPPGLYFIVINGFSSPAASHCAIEVSLPSCGNGTDIGLNRVVNCEGAGVSCENSTVVCKGNTVSGSGSYGMMLQGCAGSVVALNNFSGNNRGARQAFDSGVGSEWNTSGGCGNWWSDWQGPDADGDGSVDYPLPMDGGSGAADFFPMVWKSGGDRSGPHISVTSPKEAQAVAGNITLSAFASDLSGVQRVVFTVDNATAATARLAPFAARLNTLNLPDGPHAIRALAYDGEGNLGISAAVRAQFHNLAPAPLGLVVIAPANLTLREGEEGKLSAMALDILGTPAAADFTWVCRPAGAGGGACELNSTSGQTVAVTGTAYGAAVVEVTASYAGRQMAASCPVEVLPALARVAISPLSPTVNVWESLAFEAAAYDSANRTTPAAFVWSLDPMAGQLNRTDSGRVLFTATQGGLCTLRVEAVFGAMRRNATTPITIVESPQKSFSIYGNVSSPSGRVAGATVSVWTSLGIPVSETSSGPSGFYIIGNLTPGVSYVVKAQKAGYRDYEGSPASSPNGSALRVDIALSREPSEAAIPAASYVGIAIAAFVAAGIIFLAIPPLYSRLRKDKILDHFVRGQIYHHIRLNPGARYSELKEVLHLNNGTLTFHLRVLEMQGFIKHQRNGLYKSFYVMGVSPRGGDGIKLSRLQSRIVEMLRKSPGMCETDLAEELGAPLNVISYNIKVLSRRGMLRVEKVGRIRRCYPEPQGADAPAASPGPAA